jgi:D-alanine-D-alanine ligase
VLGTGPSARALPIVEIVAPEGNYDYQNKYFTDDTKYTARRRWTPRPRPRSSAIAVRRPTAPSAAKAGAGRRAAARTDMQPFLLEVNTSPGMTGHSLVPMAARAEGISYEDLCVEILRSAA